MARTQQHPVGNNLLASNVQFNLEELYQLAHDHVVRSDFPATSEGAIGDIVMVDTGTVQHICFKTKNGWFKSPAFTAI